ncbi:MAG: hypothetical protein IJW47_00170, partial [Clostridia bacterium]|nr:hypothetical protein [Clostridia bacterium]
MIWVLICLLLDEILSFIVGFLLLYILPALLPIGALVLLTLSFTHNLSVFNRLWSILLFSVVAVGCYYY